MNLSTQTLAKFAGVYSGLVFGVYWIPLRALDDAGFSGLWATFIFNITPLVFVVPFLLFRAKVIFSAGARFHICGVLIGLGYVSYASAFLYTEVIRVILLFYLMPIWGFLLARMITGDLITPVRWFSMLFGVVGMLVIFGVESGFPLPHNLGDWLALFAGVIWAVASLMLLTDRRNSTGNYFLVFFFWGSLFAGIFAFVATRQGVLEMANWQVFSSIAWWVILLALIVLIPAAFATLFSPSHLNPGIAGLLFMTEISVAVGTAAWLAGEPFGWREMAGVALITLAGLAEPLSNIVFKRPAVSH